jgi:thioredoxin 1
MKKVFAISFILVLLGAGCMAGGSEKPKNSPAAISAEAVKPLSNNTFKQLVYNYENSNQWKYQGKLPAIIDFYADWCGPCRVLSPRVEAIAKKYEGKIVVYKVNTDDEPKLAQSLGIQNLPTLLFIPLKGQPRATMGALPMETLEKTVSDVLLSNQ